jgi:hypothetical protein
LARATLRRAAEEMRRAEEERRAGFEAGATALYTRARDIALAAYDGDGAAEAMIVLAGDIHGSNAKRIAQFPSSEAAARAVSPASRLLPASRNSFDQP